MNIENQISIPNHERTIDKYIVIHDVGQDGSTIDNEVTYMKREWVRNQAFVHFFVDDKRIIQVANTGYRAWGAGNVNSYAPVQIEMSHVPANRIGAQLALVGQLVRMEAQKYGIPLDLNPASTAAKGIITHHWASIHYGGSDHVDPDGYLASRGVSLADLQKAIRNGATPTPQPVQPSQPNPLPAPKPTTTPDNVITVDGYAGIETVKRMQWVNGLYIDGVISGQTAYSKQFLPRFTTVQIGGGGSPLVKALQSKLGVPVDGYAGPNTIKALQRKLGVSADGYAGEATVKALQNNLRYKKLW